MLYPVLHGDQWTDILPWIILARRTTYHEELGCTPAEAVYGTIPRVPGDMPFPLSAEKPLSEILHESKAAAQRSPAQPRLHKNPTIYMPKSTETCTHVWTKVQKPTPLGRRWDGPYKILERLGDTSLKIQVGEFASGQPRSEIRHWRSCQPADFEPEETAERSKLGSPKKNDET